LRPAEPKPKSNSAMGTDLSGHQVYACGAPVVVEAARRDFAAAGFARARVLCRCVYLGAR